MPTKRIFLPVFGGGNPHLYCKSLLCEASAFSCKALGEPKDGRRDLLSSGELGKHCRVTGTRGGTPQAD